MKGLDEASSSGTSGHKKKKDVNTFINNQLKFTGGPSLIPPENMKYNNLNSKTPAKKNGL